MTEQELAEIERAHQRDAATLDGQAHDRAGDEPLDETCDEVERIVADARRRMSMLAHPAGSAGGPNWMHSE